ncbi:hypothetical protein [Streptomyces celluloflavus]|nr:hypothetical protein OG717_30285 [Streptomyces celluloflavus]
MNHTRPPAPRRQPGPPTRDLLAVIALVVLIAVGVVTLTLASTPART